MKTIPFYLTILLLLVVAVSCKENDAFFYQNDPAIYFANEKGVLNGQMDSIPYSFFIANNTVVDDTIHVKICLSGLPVDYDRPIKLIQTNVGEEDAAVSGIHFVAFDDPLIIDSVCMPRGQSLAYIPIVLLRDISLKTKEKRLKLAVGQNEYFRPGVDEFRNFTVTMADFTIKPKLWDSYWKNFFGPTFGSEKLKFIIQVTGFTEFDVYPSDFQIGNYLSIVFQKKLAEYNEAHPDNPLAEADGTLVGFY